ncbi:transporter [Streptomyces boninensis]|uniref:transporter n=1 Tax=Streptomyces boninensis TaxID=2039455 RepID=UPI003B21101A
MTDAAPMDTSAPHTSALHTSPLRTPALTALFVRLKLALLRNGLRQSTGRRAAFIASAVLALLFAALQLLGLVLLRGHDHAGALAVLLAAVLAVGWAFFPLFFPGGDETLDPTRLAMLPLRPRPLVVALLAASLVGTGPLFTLTLAAGSVISAGTGPAAALVAVPAAALLVLTCVALARAVATANIRLLTSRKGRDLALLSGLVVAIGVQLVNLGARRLAGDGRGLADLEPAADVLRWLPPASAVDAVRAASEGDAVRAVVGLALTAAALAALLWWWQRTLTRLMTSPDASTVQSVERRRSVRNRERGGLLPAGRVGTVAQRSLRYAWRDPKTKAAWASSIGVGLLIPLIVLAQGGGSVYLACAAAGMLGFQMYNQFGQDSSAFWMVAATVADRGDAHRELRGRSLAVALVAVPYVIVAALFSAALFSGWSKLPQALGISLALLGALIATGAVTSVRFPYSIPQDSGFKNVAPGQSGLAWISMLVGLIVGAVLCAPALAALIWLQLSDGSAAAWRWVLLPLGAAYGAAIAEAGLRVAAPMMVRRLPEVLTAVSKG